MFILLGYVYYTGSYQIGFVGHFWNFLCDKFLSFLRYVHSKRDDVIYHAFFA